MARDIAALIAFIDSRQHVPHAWGRKRNDCIAFGLGAIEAQTGRTIALDRDWSSYRGALRVLKHVGGVEAALDAQFERIAPAQAMRGDIAGVPDAALGIHPMIVEGDTLVAPGERGNKRVKRRAMTMAWSIERPKDNRP